MEDERWGGQGMEKVIKELCRRFERGDSAAFADLFAEDAVYIDSLYGIYKGRGAIMVFHRKCHEEAEAYKFRPVTILADEGKNAAFEWEFSFVSLMPSSRGKEITLKGASFLTLKGEKIVFYREYADSVALLLKSNTPEDRIINFYRRKYSDDKI